MDIIIIVLACAVGFTGLLFLTLFLSIMFIALRNIFKIHRRIERNFESFDKHKRRLGR